MSNKVYCNKMNEKGNITELNQQACNASSNITKNKISNTPKMKPVCSTFFSNAAKSTNNSYQYSILGSEPDFYYNGETLILSSTNTNSITNKEIEPGRNLPNINKISHKIKAISSNITKPDHSKAVITLDSDIEEVEETSEYTINNEVVIIDSTNSDGSNGCNGYKHTLSKKRRLFRPGQSKILNEGDNLFLYKCKVCNRCYKHRSSFSNHHRSECLDQPLFKCRQCCHTAVDKMSLFTHIKNKHSTYEITVFPKLQQEINSTRRLNANHSQTQLCNKRNNSILRQKSVRSEKQLPTQPISESWRHRSRQYYCAYCLRVFPRSNARLWHMKGCSYKNHPLPYIPVNSSTMMHPKHNANKKPNSFNNIIGQICVNPIYKKTITAADPIDYKSSHTNRLPVAARLEPTAVAIVKPFHILDQPSLLQPHPVALVFPKKIQI